MNGEPSSYALQVCTGELITEVADRASRYAEMFQTPVTFDFNNVHFTVNPGATAERILEMWNDYKAKKST